VVGVGTAGSPDAGSATVAVALVLACDPPLLVTLTEITYWPTLWYEWLPEILKPPPAAAAIEAADTVPSPQLIDALRSAATPSGLASVRVATVAVKAWPGAALTGTPVVVNDASATVTVNWPVNAEAPHPVWMLTLPA
jgi:hypothetical protein